MCFVLPNNNKPSFILNEKYRILFYFKKASKTLTKLKKLLSKNNKKNNNHCYKTANISKIIN